MNNETEKIKNEKIKISGTYGDKVKLYLNGYVWTKYGDFLKIKSVDQEKGYVYLYGCGEGGYDYSRISGSCKVSEDANKEYLRSLEYMFERLKIKEKSIIKFRFSETSPIEIFKVVNIIYPTLNDNDFVPRLTLEKVNNFETYEISLNDLDDFKSKFLVNVEYTPYTLEEKLRNHLDENSKFDGTIKDKDTYISTLLEIIKNESVV